MSILIPILIVIHVSISLLMVLVVLMQRPRSEGLGAAFGGGMTENLFGAQTTHVLQKFTVWLGVGFFVVTLLLAMAYARSFSASSELQRELMADPSPASAVTTVVEEAVETETIPEPASEGPVDPSQDP
jgi:preprotein translocase subunit SecG